jgi:anti-sigma-K factor RskA
MSDLDRERFEDMKEAFALGALSDEERREVKEHLLRNPEDQAEVDELISIASLLALSPVEQEPSPGLRKDLMQIVRAEASAPEPERPSIFENLTNFLGYRRLAAGVAVVALIGLLSWNLLLQGEIQDLQSRFEVAQKQPETAEPRRVLELQPAESAGQASGELIVLKGEQGLLVTKNMPQIPEGRVLQIWVIKDDKPKPSGLFHPDEEGPVAASLTRAPTKGVVVAITIEPAGGSPQPTSDPIMTTQL